MLTRLLAFLLACSVSSAATYTEFYVQSTGDNLNAGSTTNDASVRTYVGGSWDDSTGVFTLASGNPQSDGVAAGQWVSVFTDGDIESGFVGRVLSVDSTTITVSLLSASGTAPATGERTLKVGGAWRGPKYDQPFPFRFVKSSMTNSAGDVCRVNFKGGTSYAVTNTISHTNAGPIVFQGYTNAVGDAGKAIFDGGTSGASYTLFSVGSAMDCSFIDLHFRNNGATGIADMVSSTSAAQLWWRCIFEGARRRGFTTSANITMIECVAFRNNLSDDSGAGFHWGQSGTYIGNCIAYSNLNAGFAFDGSIVAVGCISFHNTGHGAISNGDQQHSIINCDFYGNTGSGYYFIGGASVMLDTFVNCNFVKNGGYAIRWRPLGHHGLIAHCGFGTGTATNVLGKYYAVLPLSFNEFGSVEYPENQTPYRSPETFDFTLASGSAINSGWQSYSAFTLGTGFAGYPSIGAVGPRSASTTNTVTNVISGFRGKIILR